MRQPWGQCCGNGTERMLGPLSHFPELLLSKFLYFAPVDSEEKQGPVTKEMPA